MKGVMNKTIASMPEKHPLRISLGASTARGGWFEQLGHYRDLVVHTAPISSAQGRAWAVIEQIQFPEGQFMPFLRLPLPNNPHEIRSQRASKDYFSDFQVKLKTFTASALGDLPSIDGLDYIWETHKRMAQSFKLMRASHDEELLLARKVDQERVFLSGAGEFGGV